jgi:hypothetical protein
MARPLGSFNRLLNLARNKDDFARRSEPPLAKNPEADLQYSLGVFRNQAEREYAGATNAEKFATGVSRPRMRTSVIRMAGVELRNQVPEM